MNLKNYHLDLSVIIPARNEAENLLYLLPQVHQVLTNLKISYEIIIVDEDANQETYAIVKKNSAKLIIPNSKGYGVALQAGFQEAYGAYIVTMDADLSHSPEFLTALWMHGKMLHYHSVTIRKARKSYNATVSSCA